MEDRTTPATASLVGSTLTIDFTAAGDQVVAEFNGTSIQLSGSFTGTPSPFTGVDRILIQDSGNLAGQKMTFAGTIPFSLPNGLSSTGIETFAFNQAVDAGGSSAAISVAAPVSIAVRSDLTGGKGGVSLVANPTAAGTSTYGILVENGATITTTGNGDTVLTGTSGNSGSGYRTGVVLQGAATVSAGGAGRVTITGTGGFNSGPSNLGVSVADTSAISSDGGDIIVRGTGGTGQGSGNIGIRLSSSVSIAASGLGGVSLEGVGGSGSGTGNHGIALVGTAKITTQGGTVSVLATGTTGGAGAAGLAMEALTLIQANGGLISLASDSIETSGASIVSTGGTVAIAPRSAGLPIGIGTVDRLTGAISLGLSLSELSSISAGSLTIGSGASGAITVYANISLTSAPVLGLVSGGSINASASTVALSVASIDMRAGTGIGDAQTLRTASKGIFATSSSGSVAINNANAGLTSADLSGSSVAFTTTGALDIAGHSITGNLSIQARGDIIQSSAFTVGGVATFGTAADSDITLHLSNDFASIGVTGGRNVVIRDTGAVALNASAIAGNLSVFSGGALSDNGNLVVSGSTTLDAGIFDITLDNGNDFGSLGITTANNATIRDTGAIDLAASNIAGTLSVQTSGAITQSGALIITGAATFDAKATNNITLNNFDNDFSAVGITAANNATIRDINALALNASTISGQFNASINGDLSDNGPLAVGGVATLTAEGHDITLDNKNDFSVVGITAANNATIRDINALALNASTISGDLTVFTGGALTDNGDLVISGVTTLDAGSSVIILDNNNDFNFLGITAAKYATIKDINALALNGCTIAGNLNVTADGDITDNGPLVVGGTARFDTGPGHDLVLDHANSFGSLALANARNASISTAGGLALEACVITGDLTVTTGGDLIDNGPISVAGVTTLTALGHDITLDNQNDFNSLGVPGASNATINDINAIALKASGITGGLTITAVGDISQNGLLSVGGIASFNATGHDITLADNNDFNFLGVSNALDVILNDANALILNSCAIAGNLTVTTNGDLTDNGPLAVAAIATLDCGNHDITFDNSNRFHSLGIINTENALINNTIALVLNGVVATGNLSVTAAGDITQTEMITVYGDSSFNAGASGDITLDYANDFDSISFPNAKNVAVFDANSLVLSGGLVNGALNVLVNDGISQSAGIRVIGAASLNGGGSIRLDQANDFSSVEFFAGVDVTVNDINAVEIRESIVNGVLEVTAAGSILSMQNLNVAGATTFNSTAAGSISVTRLFAQDVIVANTVQGNASIVNQGPVRFSGTVNGVFSLRSLTDSITDQGPVTATGGLSLQAPGDSRLDQDLAGPGGLSFSGSGTLTLAGQNTFYGPTRLSGGTIVLTGSLAQSPVTVSAGLLTGSGSLKSLSVTGGTVTPDLNFDCAPLSLGKAGRLVLHVGGLVPGMNQAQVTASSVALAGKLVIVGNLSFQTVIGGRITLINNIGASRVSGQFAGLPEGAQVLVNGMRYFISYRGGMGKNDVVLNRPTVIAASASNRLVTVFDKDGKSRASVLPFGNYMGKVTVATGDVTGDGVPDVITGSGRGNAPHVRVFNGVNLGGVFSFYALEPSFRGEVAVAAGDINGDGKSDIMAAAGRGDPGLVRVYSGDNLAVLKSFFPFGSGFTGGVTVAAGDFNNDGIADIVCGTDGNSLSTVRVFDGSTGAILRTWQPFPSFSVGVSLAVGDFNGDGRADILAGARAGANPVVAILNGASWKNIASFNAFGAGYRNGVAVAAMDYNGDGVDEVVATPLAVNFSPMVRIIARPGSRTVREFTAILQPGGASVTAWN